MGIGMPCKEQTINKHMHSWSVSCGAMSHVGGAKDFVFFTANFDPHILAGQSVLYCLPHMAHGAHMPAKDLRASCPEADGVTCVRPSQDGFRVGFNFSRRAE
jgi:hypothetical protein